VSGECLDHEAHERTRKARKAFVCFAPLRDAQGRPFALFVFQTACIQIAQMAETW